MKRRDLLQTAIDTLPTKGTPRAAALAAELERGQDRSATRHDPELPCIDPDNPRDSFRHLRNTRLAAQRAERETRRAGMDDRFRNQDEGRAFMLAQLRKGAPSEYEEWLKDYLLAGGRPTHFYDCPTPTVWVATCDLEVRPLYGASAFNMILIPQRFSAHGETGHTNLYFFRSHLYQGFHDAGPRQPWMVPVYSDTELP